MAPLGETDEERRDRNLGERTPAFTWASLWQSRMLWHLTVIYFAFGFSYVIYATCFIRYLVGERRMAAKDAGLLWLEIGVVSIVSGFIWGGLSDRWGRRAALVGVFLVQGAAFLAFGMTRAWPILYVSAALFGRWWWWPKARRSSPPRSRCATA